MMVFWIAMRQKQIAEAHAESVQLVLMEYKIKKKQEWTAEDRVLLLVLYAEMEIVFLQMVKIV